MLIYSRNDNSNQLTKDRFKYELAYELSDKNSLSMFNLEWTGFEERVDFLKLAICSRWLASVAVTFQGKVIPMIPRHQLAGSLRPLANGSIPFLLPPTLLHFFISTKLQKWLPVVGL